MTDARDTAPPLRPARRFDDGGRREEDPLTLQAHREFVPGQQLAPEPQDAEADALLAPGFERRPRRRWLAGLLLATLLLGGLQFGAWLLDAWRGDSLLGVAWSALALAAIGLGGGALLRELWRLRQLRGHMLLRDRAGDHWGSEAIGEGLALCQQLRKDSGIAEQDPRWQAFLAGDAAHHSDAERLQRYARHLLTPRDQQARAEVSRAASETAVMVAVSPLAWVDMLLLAWRTLRMLERIAGLYGLRLGYASRLQLFRSLLLNMALTGAAELASDAGADLLALGVAGRLSTRLAQGLGAGLITARLGFRAMALCRPLPFGEGERPRLSTLRQALLADLQRLAGKDRESNRPQEQYRENQPR